MLVMQRALGKLNSILESMKTRTLLFAFITSVLITGCSSTPTLVYRHPSFDTTRSYRVAVFPLKDAANAKGSGDTFASLFEAALLSSGKVEVVERTEIDRVLHERRPDASAEFEDPVAVGKLLRADLVVVGKVSNWSLGRAGLWNSRQTVVGASVRAISVEKGVVVWSLDKSTESDLFTMPTDAPADVVARKLCRQMVQAFVGTNRN